jgi:type II secretory pathway component GspD/PulD (secretin)
MKQLRKITQALLLLIISTVVSAETISLSLQDVDIGEAMQLLSKEQRLNIFVTEGVSGDVSVNLYDMETIEAINLIAESAGFVVEKRNNSFFIIKREDAGKFHQTRMTEVRSLKVQYAALSEIEEILEEHLSSFGSIKSLQESNMLVVQDLPPFLDSIEILLAEVDREPKQILIEAKILEISLIDNQSFGINWSKIFNSADPSGSIGTQGLASSTSGLFAEYNNSNIDLVLNALKERGRLRTISTPKLLAMEGREASTQVGTRIGFKVTTTTNQVTTESIEFLETGIILKVTPSVDRSGRIMLVIQPEVSAGTVSDDGIPSKSTTEVSTRMLVPNGKTVFMGGLIRHSVSNSREGVPGLGDLPLIGGLFANDSKNINSSEIVVLITPRIVNYNDEIPESNSLQQVQTINEIIESEIYNTKAEMREVMDDEGQTNTNTVDIDDRGR